MTQMDTDCREFGVIINNFNKTKTVGLSFYPWTTKECLLAFVLRKNLGPTSLIAALLR